jgi:hypothetical protein
MKLFNFIPLIIVLFSVAQASIKVSSIGELQNYLQADNVSIRMEPGTYRIAVKDVECGHYQEPMLLQFAGSHSTFDFTGVTIEVETGVFQSFGKVSVQEIAVTGKHLVLQGLTLVDIGQTHPKHKAQSVLLDGADNRIEGFHVTTRGSYPYGYGDIFGKGGPYVIKHYKHSAILVRGDRNHLKNCTVIQRAYGHGIFCQGSIDAVIEGCYVEGEMRTTDEVLAEKGTGSPADQVNFKSIWGYRVPPGWMFSLQEDGIRAYNTGRTLSGGERRTKNLKVINCTVKNMRSGVTIGFCDGDKLVQNCSVIGNENGYWVGSGGRIIDCEGDARFGPLYSNNYQQDKNSVVDLTLLDSSDAYGNDLIAYIGGKNHKITLRSETPRANSEMHLQLGGIRTGLRFHEINPKYNDFSATNIQLNNISPYPVVVSSKSSFKTQESYRN